MESALIVSSSVKSLDFFAEMLSAVSCDQIVTQKSGKEARRLLSERDFDLVIINAPLCDESGESLSWQFASGGNCQVILVVQSERFGEASAAAEEYGVLTIEKPISRVGFRYVLKLAESAQTRFRLMQKENSRLTQKIEDIRIIDRAKCILISYMGMSEQQAHKYIERQAMDERRTKRDVSEAILKTYES